MRGSSLCWSHSPANAQALKANGRKGGRSYLYLLKEEFKAKRTQLRALNDRGDDSPEGELTDGILDQLGKYEWAKMAERSRRGKLRRAKEGKVVAIKETPYGFRYNDARDGFVVHEPEMAIVRRIFEMVGGEGLSINATAHTLKRDGILSPNGSPHWSRKTIRLAIRDDLCKPHAVEEIRPLVSPEVAAKLEPEKRYGLWYYNRIRRITTKVPTLGDDGQRRYVKRSRIMQRPKEEWIAVPIVDSSIERSLVDAAREAVRENKSKPSLELRTWELAEGMARCGCCGRALYRNPIRKKDRHYYRCAKRREHGAEACELTGRRADELEREVWERVRAVLLDPERLERDIQADIEAKKSRLYRNPEGERERWLKVLEQSEHKRARAQEAYMADAMSLADLKARTAKLEQDERIARGELERLGRVSEEMAKLEELKGFLSTALWAGRETLLKVWARDSIYVST